MRDAPELTPTAFRERWKQAEEDQVTLLDVREPEELALAALAEAVHIPMAEIPQRLGELSPHRTIVVMCHSGGRSRLIARFLTESGFEQVFNLAGGIDAWSQQIDSSIPRY
jgi:rhodanese-related sulfurtransferase